MRIIISGGGTGGHIYPAIAIAKALAKLVQPCEILFVGTQQGLEADIIPKEGYDFTTIEVRGLERRLSWQNLVTFWRAMLGTWQSRRILNHFKPDLVIGTGGYVCGPVLLMASLMNIPTLIQEQNAIPGVTNKILARFVKQVAVGYSEAAPYFPCPDKVVYTGNPVREEVMAVTRETGMQSLKLDANKLTILASGGSRGAHSINKAMLDVNHYFADRVDIQVLHVTGKSDYNNIVSLQQKSGIDFSNTGNIIITPYLYNMPHALAVADLAIFRAGAIGLAELTARGIPSILVPYPHAAENHQEYNARALEKHGAAVVIPDSGLSGTALLERVSELINSKQKLHEMALASRSLGRPDAATEIARLALKLV